MSFCLPKYAIDKFIQALPEDVNQLVDMTSAERRAFFSDTLGPESAQKVNSLFESKLLLKNTQQGLQNWVKKVTGISPEVKRDMLAKVDRLSETLQPESLDLFLEDLVAQRLGIEVSYSDAGRLAELAGMVKQKKQGLESGAVDRLDYGESLVKFRNYVADLKIKARNKPLKEKIKEPGGVLTETSAAFKSSLAALDNSFPGRQGFKTLFVDPKIWAKTFKESWKDIYKSLKGEEPIDVLKADIYSRPNALNGKYQAAKIAVDILGEEAFPSSLPERIPVFGKLFTASQDAYNGAALRMRADLADKWIKMAEDQGINVLNKEQARGIGELVNSLTGRGSLGRFEPGADILNAWFFSPRYLKANYDVLTAHALNKNVTPFARKIAAQNLMKIVGGTAAILTVANMLHPGSVNLDPRSADFGKIRIGNTRFDISGGVNGLVTLASRLVPTQHNGDWGFWSKSSTSGRFTNLTSGKYGQRTAVDVAEDFFEGKLSPAAGVMRDIYTGTHFTGEEITPVSIVKTATVPLPIVTYQELAENKDSANILASMILNEIGIGVNTYGD